MMTKKEAAEYIKKNWVDVYDPGVVKELSRAAKILADAELEEGWKPKEGELVEQLQTLRGVLGKYNCQHGGRTCEFQVNFHRLVNKEIELLTKMDAELEEGWKPKELEPYWTIVQTEQRVARFAWQDSDDDEIRWERGNVYKTKYEALAQALREESIRKAISIGDISAEIYYNKRNEPRVKIEMPLVRMQDDVPGLTYYLAWEKVEYGNYEKPL